MAEITQPGCYELTEAAYHADPVVGGSLSSTGARTLLTCPARFAYDREHGRPDTAAFDFGRAAHTLVLGEGAPIVEIDAEDWRTKAAKEAAAEARDAGATPLLTKDAARVRAMADALRLHSVAGPLFDRPGKAEQSFVARDPESGVMCRVRLDWMPDVDDDTRLICVDYKSTRDAHPAAFAKSMATFGYHQQAAFYLDALAWLQLDHGLDSQFVFVAQEKEPPYLVTVGYPLAGALEWGRVLNRKARDVYRECTETGHWPGYSDAIEPLDLPGWLDHQYEAAFDAGRYATLADLS